MFWCCRNAQDVANMAKGLDRFQLTVLRCQLIQKCWLDQFKSKRLSTLCSCSQPGLVVTTQSCMQLHIVAHSVWILPLLLLFHLLSTSIFLCLCSADITACSAANMQVFMNKLQENINLAEEHHLKLYLGANKLQPFSDLRLMVGLQISGLYRSAQSQWVHILSSRFCVAVGYTALCTAAKLPVHTVLCARSDTAGFSSPTAGYPQPSCIAEGLCCTM